jgi:hypothetical protein
MPHKKRLETWPNDGVIAVSTKRYFGQMTVGQMSVGQMSVGQISVGQMSVGQMSVGQMSVGQMSVGQMSVGQMSVGQMSVGQMSVGQMYFDQKKWGPKHLLFQHDLIDLRHNRAAVALFSLVLLIGKVNQGPILMLFFIR